MTYPLGQSADRAAYERARLELQQNRAQIRRIELQVASEVTQRRASHRVDSRSHRGRDGVAGVGGNNGSSREESKFEVGLSTNFFVLQSQRDNRHRTGCRVARFSTTSGP